MPLTVCILFTHGRMAGASSSKSAVSVGVRSGQSCLPECVLGSCIEVRMCPAVAPVDPLSPVWTSISETALTRPPAAQQAISLQLHDVSPLGLDLLTGFVVSQRSCGRVSGRPKGTKSCKSKSACGLERNRDNVYPCTSQCRACTTDHKLECMDINTICRAPQWARAKTLPRKQRGKRFQFTTDPTYRAFAVLLAN